MSTSDASVNLLLKGPPGCGKSSALRARAIAAIRGCVAAGRRIAVCCSSEAAAQAWLDAAREDYPQTVLANIDVTTLEQLARDVLRDAGVPVARNGWVTPARRRAIVRWLLDAARGSMPRTHPFILQSRTRGFVRLLSATFAELLANGAAPEVLTDAAGAIRHREPFASTAAEAAAAVDDADDNVPLPLGVRRDLPARLAALADVFNRYVEHIDAHGFTDPEALPILAARAVQQQPEIGRRRLVIVDNASRLHAGEIALVGALLASGARLHAALDLPTDEPAAHDTVARAYAMAEQVRLQLMSLALPPTARFSERRVSLAAAYKQANPTRWQLAATLTAEPAAKQHAPNVPLDGIAVATAMTVQDEIARAVGEVLRLRRLHNVSPSRIAILLADAEEYGPPLARALDEAGVPHDLANRGEQPTVRDTALARLALDLLEAGAGAARGVDWEEMLAVRLVTNPLLPVPARWALENRARFTGLVEWRQWLCALETDSRDRTTDVDATDADATSGAATSGAATSGAVTAGAATDANAGDGTAVDADEPDPEAPLKESTALHDERAEPTGRADVRRRGVEGGWSREADALATRLRAAIDAIASVVRGTASQAASPAGQTSTPAAPDSADVARNAGETGGNPASAVENGGHRTEGQATSVDVAGIARALWTALTDLAATTTDDAQHDRLLRESLNATRRGLRAVVHTFETLPRDAASIEAYAQALDDAFESTRLRVDTAVRGGVLRVLPLRAADALGRADHLFVLGMSEVAFPRYPASDPLLTDAERTLIASTTAGATRGAGGSVVRTLFAAQAPVALPARALQARGEDYVGVVALTRARVRCCLSRSLAGASGGMRQVRVHGARSRPSPLFADLARALLGDEARVGELPGLVPAAGHGEVDEAVSRGAWWAGALTPAALQASAAAAAWRRVDPSLASTQAAWCAVARVAERGATAAEDARSLPSVATTPRVTARNSERAARFGELLLWGGRDSSVARFADDTLRARFGSRLAAPTHPFSATRVGRFANCPYAHFARYHLGLKEHEPRAPRHLAWGAMNHRVLEEFGRAVTGGEEWVDPEAAADWAGERLGALLQQHLGGESDDPYTALEHIAAAQRLRFFIHEEVMRLRHAPGAQIVGCELEFGRRARNVPAEGSACNDRVAAHIDGRDSRIEAESRGEAAPLVLDDTTRSLTIVDDETREPLLIFEGSIDRVDRITFTNKNTGETAIYAVCYDYKSNRQTFYRKKFKALAHYDPDRIPDPLVPRYLGHRADELPTFQLAIYMFAIRDLWGLAPGGALFYGIGDLRKGGMFLADLGRLIGVDASDYSHQKDIYWPDALKPDEFEHFMALAEHGLRRLGRRMRDGEISIDPYECQYCEFRRMCRFEKTLADEGRVRHAVKRRVLGPQQQTEHDAPDADVADGLGIGADD